MTKGEDLFVFLVIELLDGRTRREWENAINESTLPPSFTELEIFLERRMQTLDALQLAKQETASSKGNDSSRKAACSLHVQKKEADSGRCALCKGDHFVMFCKSYKSKSPEERRQLVQSSSLCSDCLGKHQVSECASKKTCSALSATVPRCTTRLVQLRRPPTRLKQFTSPDICTSKGPP